MTKHVENILKLKEPFEALYQNYSREYLKTDPLWFAHQYQNPLDQEAVAFIASAFAYGSVEQIFKILHSLLKVMGPSPVKFLRDYCSQPPQKLFEGFYYRFHKSKDIQVFLYLLSEVYRRENSLGALFKKHYHPDSADLSQALDAFTREILSYSVKDYFSSHLLPQNSRVRFFFSSPKEGSSCKRLNLFLRWMVRKEDGLDLGLWDFASPSQLTIPLDTHIYWVASSLGFTRRQSPHWKTAAEITENLKLLDSLDPVKYDFALSRLGILELCPPEELGIPCKKCKKRSDCRRLKGRPSHAF